MDDAGHLFRPHLKSRKPRHKQAVFAQSAANGPEVFHAVQCADAGVFRQVKITDNDIVGFAFAKEITASVRDFDLDSRMLPDGMVGFCKVVRQLWNNPVQFDTLGLLDRRH